MRSPLQLLLIHSRNVQRPRRSPVLLLKDVWTFQSVSRCVHMKPLDPRTVFIPLWEHFPDETSQTSSTWGFLFKAVHAEDTLEVWEIRLPSSLFKKRKQHFRLWVSWTIPTCLEEPAAALNTSLNLSLKLVHIAFCVCNPQAGGSLPDWLELSRAAEESYSSCSPRSTKERTSTSTRA